MHGPVPVGAHLPDRAPQRLRIDPVSPTKLLEFLSRMFERLFDLKQTLVSEILPTQNHAGQL